jgi:YrbI family 3-deoxy-D-manno-octulosonate 8-phosphate phosphatase
VTRVLVTTDDEEIAEVARQYGAETPFLRPAELAGDLTPDLPVFQHAVEWLAAQENYHPEIVVQLRPTAPVRPVDIVDRTIHLLLAHPEADSVRGVTPAHENPFKMWLLDGEENPMNPLIPVTGMEESFNAPRQALPFAYWHTPMIDAMRPSTLLKLNSMSGKIILPVIHEPGYATDLDSPDDWTRAEWLAIHGGLNMVRPGKIFRNMPKKIEMLVLDFDGVLTDNRVWVDQDGREMVAANRSDSFGISLLRQAGVKTMVISKETNPVVAARCRKMNIPCIQGEDDKASTLKKSLSEHNIDLSSVVYCGNDINDLPCFPLVGWAVAVADSLPEVLRQADFVLSRSGGHAAVRELCDLILEKKGK